MSDGRKCGCKGIRTCLLCEQLSEAYVERREITEVRYIYTYCPECNLCWPDNEETASMFDFPLYLGNLEMCLNFFTEEEEILAITSIDKIPWMPSQSGRRKQDFGPKVNFKKKKVKLGEFKGFPRFTENILPKFQHIPGLSDFQPVELCHLEYSPERGSSIDPHVDDFWLWGERLVTINLGSPTVLTLVPCSEDVCKCYQQASCYFSQRNSLLNGSRSFSCDHKFQSRYSTRRSKKALTGKTTTAGESSNDYTENLRRVSENSKFGTGIEECPVSKTEACKLLPKSNTQDDIPYPSEQLSYRLCKMLIGDNNSFSDSKCSSEAPHLTVDEKAEVNRHVPEQNDSDIVSNEYPLICNCDSPINDNTNINTMCNLFRKSLSDLKVAVRIVLPPRSLFVLAGCARYNWFHEIQRQDVVSRRLAMTFRELTAEFLEGGNESQIGRDLLMTANKFV